MIDLEWIIKTENELTDRAKFDLGDNYFLTLDLLKLLQSIKSFSPQNEVSYYFDAQIVKDMHLVVLNTIRRHNIEANIILRHALESISLFIYSMEYKNETVYQIARENNQIVSFNNNLLKKANKFFEQKYPEFSKIIEGYKEVINLYFSHANIFSSQFNTADIEGRIKLLVFDNYYDNLIRETLGVVNEIICIILQLYQILVKEYKSFILEKDFDRTLEDYLKRQDKLKKDMYEKMDNEERVNFPHVNKIVDKLNKKYKNK